MPSDRSHAEPLEGVVVTVRVLAVQVLEQVDLGTAGLARGGRRIDVGVGHPQHPQRRRRMQRGRRRQHRHSLRAAASCPSDLGLVRVSEISLEIS